VPDFRVFTDAASLKRNPRLTTIFIGTHFRVFTDAASLKPVLPHTKEHAAVLISASSQTRPH
jgi:hypothetical protein